MLPRALGLFERFASRLATTPRGAALDDDDDDEDNDDVVDTLLSRRLAAELNASFGGVAGDALEEFVELELELESCIERRAESLKAW